jgi:hypothetical protein
MAGKDRVEGVSWNVEFPNPPPFQEYFLDILAV